MVTLPFNLKTYILCPGGGSEENADVAVMDIVSPKYEEPQFPPKVYHMTVNHHHL